jgi:hypothetical protein
MGQYIESVFDLPSSVAGSMLKCKEKRELRVLFKTVQDQIRENWKYDLSN